MRIEANINGKITPIELPDGSTPEQIDEVIGHVTASNPSFGAKIERDAMTAAKGAIGGNIFDAGAAYGNFITDAAGDALGSLAGPEATETVQKAKEWIGSTWAGKAAQAVAENAPESVSKSMQIMSPLFAVSGVKEIAKPTIRGAKTLNKKLGNESKGGVPLSEAGPNMVKGAKFSDMEEIQALQKAGDDAVSEAYQGIKGTLKPEAEQALNAKLLDSIGSMQINPAASPKTIGAVKALYDRITIGKINPITGAVTKAPLTVPEVDGFRRLLKNTSGEDAAASGQIRSTIDDFLNNMDEASFSEGGPQAVEKLNAARATAARNFRMQKFSDMVMKAEGNPNKIQKAAFNFLKDKDNLTGLDPEAIAALKAVRDGTGGQKAMQFLGRLGFDQNSAWGPTVLGLIGGAPITIPATAARFGNKLAVRGTAQKALETLAKNPTPKPVKKVK